MSEPNEPRLGARRKASARSIGGRKSRSAMTSTGGAELNEDTRRAMIAEAAYFRAERRGFAPGFELDDWLASEHELDARLQSQSLERSAVGGGELH